MEKIILNITLGEYNIKEVEYIIKDYLEKIKKYDIIKDFSISEYIEHKFNNCEFCLKNKPKKIYNGFIVCESCFKILKKS